MRVHTALSDPNLRDAPVDGILRSDPALLHYLTGRIVDAGGGFPADFRADPRVQHPARTDVPAEFTIGQELVVAWAHLGLGALGVELPLWRTALFTMALTASLAAVGVYLAARALAGGVPWALVAAVLFAFLPAGYRTIGFVLVREDVSLPLFALHLGLAARAWTRGAVGPPPRGTYLASGLALAAALATWHAMGFVVAVELACLVVWLARSGRGPFDLRGAWLAAVPVVAAALAVPALAARGFAFSVPMQLAAALGAASLPAVRRRGRAARLAAAAAAGLAVHGLGRLTAGLVSQPGGYAHVWEVLAAKLRHGGRFPTDPGALSFDARLLWQGPFEGLNVPWALGAHGWALAAAVPAGAWLARAWWTRGGGRSADALLSLGLVVAALFAWLFERLLVLPALLAPLAVALALARLAPSGREAGAPARGGARLAAAGALAVLLLQGSSLLAYASSFVGRWYLPPERQPALAALVGWAREELGPGVPLVGDFVTSPALLARVGTPIVLQPKYETEDARRRAEAFVETFFHGSPDELRRLVTERFRARHLVVDRLLLGSRSRDLAGLRPADPLPPGSAAEVLLSVDADVLASVPGYTLVHRTPASIRRADGEPSDRYRVFRLR